jgi:hypothetical protein
VIAVIDAAFRTRLMARVGPGVRRTIAVRPTAVAAVGLPTVAEPADVKDLVTPTAAFFPQGLLLVHGEPAPERSS